MENTERFSGLADVYTMGRPSYARELFEFLYEEQGFSRRSVIADIGCGTGKFARGLLERGSLVYGVEPNEDMRKKACQELAAYETFRLVNGTDAATTLKGHSVDFITAAQAFHWFDGLLFREECRRILKERGMVFLVWNTRDPHSEVNQKSARIFARYCPDFKGFSGGMQKDDRKIREFFDGNYQCREFAHPLVYREKHTFISRCLSASYSLKEGQEHYGEYMAELSELYETCAGAHGLTVENHTVVYFGRVR